MIIMGMAIAVFIKISSNGPILHWSKRIGQHNKAFLMPKFRTMKINSPDVATHLLENPENYITKVGRFLRKTSLDEIPQLYSVIVGDMTFVGPRPALFNQYDLISLRTENNVHKMVPGITGWAQINGRDDLSIKEKVNFDIEYIKLSSLYFDLKVLLLTLRKIFVKKGISH